MGRTREYRAPVVYYTVSTHIVLAVIILHAIACFSLGPEERTSFVDRSVSIGQSHPFQESASLVESENKIVPETPETPSPSFHDFDPGHPRSGATILHAVFSATLFRSSYRDICHLRV